MGTKGYRSTEFWLTVLSQVLGALMVSGIFPDDSGWMKAIGAGSSILGLLGYQVTRMSFKKTKLQADSLLAGVAGAVAGAEKK